MNNEIGTSSHQKYLIRVIVTMPWNVDERVLFEQVSEVDTIDGVYEWCRKAGINYEGVGNKK